MGAEAQSATAIVTVPPGLESKVEDLLFQMMSGAVEVLNEAGCALVGGHTGEGQRTGAGLRGQRPDRRDLADVMRKGGMRPGDVLILTKPIGTGTLFAAHARLQARGRWIDAALASMCQSNRAGAQLPARARRHRLHRPDRLRPARAPGGDDARRRGVDAELDLAALPVLDGAEETVAAGILSSLQPANVRLRRALRNPAGVRRPSALPAAVRPADRGRPARQRARGTAEACLANCVNWAIRKPQHRPGPAARRRAGADTAARLIETKFRSELRRSTK